MLTLLQKVVLAKLREHKCHILAEATEKAWSNHEFSYMDDRVNCPRRLRRWFAAANNDAMRAGEEGNP